MLSLRGLATGIGSLPHKDVDSALDLIFKYLGRIPFWPQLPKRDYREGMIAQFSENLPCIRITGDGVLFYSEDREKELEIFYSRIIENNVQHFKITYDFAQGLHKFYQRLSKIDLNNVEFIKCHVTGPFTFLAAVSDENGVALLHDKIMMQAVIKALTMKAIWQIELFRKFNKKIIIFFDEPYLSCFGSAYTPINREDIIRGLEEALQAVKARGALTGVHCCGNTDWSMLTDVNSLDIISFDAFDFQDKFVLYASNLKDFLERGGIICWGIVPTQEIKDGLSPDLLVEKINYAIAALAKKGINRDLLAQNLLLSPSCGLGSLDVERSDKIFKLLYETSLSLEKVLGRH